MVEKGNRRRRYSKHGRRSVENTAASQRQNIKKKRVDNSDPKISAFLFFGCLFVPVTIVIRVHEHCCTTELVKHFKIRYMIIIKDILSEEAAYTLVDHRNKEGGNIRSQSKCRGA